jgi:hypothetical protein
MAGFEVTPYGRFCLTPEGPTTWCASQVIECGEQCSHFPPKSWRCGRGANSCPHEAAGSLTPSACCAGTSITLSPRSPHFGESVRRRCGVYSKAKRVFCVGDIPEPSENGGTTAYASAERARVHRRRESASALERLRRFGHRSDPSFSDTGCELILAGFNPRRVVLFSDLDAGVT